MVISPLHVDNSDPIASDPQPDSPKRALRVSMLDAITPQDYDNGSADFTDAVTEVYRFFKGATLLRTVTLVYATPAKDASFTWVIT